MISLKEFLVTQFLFIQVISAWCWDPTTYQSSPNLAEYQLTAVHRPIRQADNQPDNGYLQANNNNGVPINNGINYGNNLPNNLALSNGLPNNLAFNNEFPNNLAFINGLPNEFLLSNGLSNNFNNGPPNNVVINNGLPNNLAINNGLPNNFALNNGMLNNVAFNTGLPNNPAINNGLTNLAINNGLSNNFAPNNGLPNNLAINNGLTNNLGINNGLANNVAANNGIPNNLAPNNGLVNNIVYNNGFPNNLAFDNGLPNKPLLNLPVSNINNAAMNAVFPGNSQILPFNNMPNGLPNINNVPEFNGLQNVNNGRTGPNFFNRNNLAIANTLPYINNLPSSNTLPSVNGLPLSNVPTGNSLLPNYSAYKNQLPNINNFQITGFGFLNNGLSNIYAQNYLPINKIPNNLPISNGFSNLNFPSGNRLLNYNNVPTFDGATNNNLQTNNQLPIFNNVPFANILPPNTEFTSINNPINNGNINFNNLPTNTIVQSNNNLPLNKLNNGWPVAGNSFINNNIVPINDQQLVNNIPFNNGFVVANNFQGKELQVNNGMPLFNPVPNNGQYLNNAWLPASSTPVTPQGVRTGYLRNNLQLGNLQMPVVHSPFEFVSSNSQVNENLVGDRLPSLTNCQDDCQSTLASNNLNLAQELVNSLQIDGFASLPCINGLPIAGITETVTLLNNPCN